MLGCGYGNTVGRSVLASAAAPRHVATFEGERNREIGPDRPFKFFFFLYCRKPVALSWMSHRMRS